MLIINRNGRPKVFYKKAYLGNLSKFTGKYLCQGLFLIKLLTFFNEIAGLKSILVKGVLLWILQNFSELLSSKTPAGEYFWTNFSDNQEVYPRYLHQQIVLIIGKPWTHNWGVLPTLLWIYNNFDNFALIYLFSLMNLFIH